VKQLWDLAHNRDKVSANVLAEEDVAVVEVDGGSIVAVHVRRALRRERPVYIGKNPLAGTYMRRFEGDYRCDEATVKRMLADQANDSRDERILPEFGLADLDGESLRSYRQRFQNRSPSHPWNDRENRAFLEQLGGWRKDRVSGEEGLTIGGLLMFGKLRSIQDELPEYHVDYQEWAEAAEGGRWSHRITTDGTWSGNVFDFFRRVYRTMTSDLRVPFKIRHGVREEETPVHEALREALVNSLIHADWEARSAVLVVRKPDLFEFRNPGTMRVPVQVARKGGDSDCRNRAMQRMFRMVGFGEQAGSGIPKILRNWEGQSWRAPVLEEDFEREQTRLRLHMVSLLPESAMKELRERLGTRFENTSVEERLALVTAAAEGSVSHARLRELSDSHSRDLTLMLVKLATEGLLKKEGAGRGTKYVVGEFGEGLLPFPELGRSGTGVGPQQGGEDSVQSPRDSVQSSGDSVQSSGDSVQSAVEHSKKRAWAPRKSVEKIILEACSEHFLSIAELAGRLGRSTATIRINYVNQLLKEGLLEERYPGKKNHPRQAYRTVKKGKR